MRIDQHQRQNKPTSIIDDTVEHAHTYLVANRLQLVCQRNIIIWLHRRPKIIMRQQPQERSMSERTEENGEGDE